MEILSQWNASGSYFWCFAISIVSALVPWVNGEVLLLSLAALAHSPWAIGVLVLSASAGQMTGKCVLYWAGKGVIPLESRRVRYAIAKWKGRFEQSSPRMLALVFVSSALGIPPFFVTTILAGVSRVPFAPFVAVGTCGRLVRFGTIAFVPWIMLHWLR